MSSTEPGARGCLDTPFLLREIPLGSALEELELVYRRRRETSRTLGDREDARRLEQAYALARSCLEAVLNEAHVPGSPLLADAPSAREVGTESETGTSGPSPDPRNARGSPESPSPDAAGGSA